MSNAFITMGASSHGKRKRDPYDYYATDPAATRALLEVETFNKDIWEPCCGEFHISKVLSEEGYNVRNSDLIVRNGLDIEQLDFLEQNEKWHGDIVTNPPYKQARQCILKALDCVEDGAKVCVLLKILFLESKIRYRELFSKHPPKIIYVFSGRANCAINGDFEKDCRSAVCYAWFVWEKGWFGDPIIKWLNTD